ncbi:MAG: transglycosylase domain-containing protein, partial [Leptospirales bacterium]
RWNVKTIEETMISSIGDFPDRAYRLNRAPFFLNYIKSVLLTQFSSEVITEGGLKVYTTLDYGKQKIATEMLAKQIKKQKEYYDKLITKASAKNKIKYQAAKDQTNGVFISLEPSTGHVLTMIGGTEFSTGNQFNRALKAYRQVGSLMKPFVYYLALLNEYVTPATIVSDSPFSKGGFTFKNYDYKYLGDITVYEALKRSRNTVAVRLMEQVGHKKLRDLMADLLNIDYGTIKKRIPAEIGVALGTVEFTPLEMAMAYGAFINNGLSVTPKYILKVQQNNKTLYEPKSEDSRHVVDPSTSFVLINMMQGVFTPNGTASWVSRYRTKYPDRIPYQIAGKTGTTSGYKDAWFVGLTSDEVSIVWVGSDYNASLGNGRSGGSLCSPAWINYIVSSKRNSPSKNFSEIYTLDNITYENFCPVSGGVPHDESLCLEQVEHPFLAGTEPDFFCPLHDPLPPPPAIEEEENNFLEGRPGENPNPVDGAKTEAETPVLKTTEPDLNPAEKENEVESETKDQKST